MRLKFTKYGRIVPRSARWVSNAAVIATTMCTHSGEIRSNIPELFQLVYDVLIPRLFDSRDRLQKLAPDVEETIEMPTVPESLLTKVPARTFEDDNLVNKRIDRDVRKVKKIVRSMLGLPQSTPQYQAAARLNAYFFADNDKYLYFSGGRQWVVVNTLFCENTDQFMEDAIFLGLKPLIDIIQPMNDYYGEMLNITALKISDLEKVDLKESEKEALDDFHKLMGEFISFTNLVWPDDTKEDNTRRMDLIGPYVTFLQDDSKRISAKVKKALKNKKDKADDNSDHTP